MPNNIECKGEMLDIEIDWIWKRGVEAVDLKGEIWLIDWFFRLTNSVKSMPLFCSMASILLASQQISEVETDSLH